MGPSKIRPYILDDRFDFPYVIYGIRFQDIRDLGCISVSRLLSLALPLSCLGDPLWFRQLVFDRIGGRRRRRGTPHILVRVLKSSNYAFGNCLHCWKHPKLLPSFTLQWALIRAAKRRQIGPIWGHVLLRWMRNLFASGGFFLRDSIEGCEVERIWLLVSWYFYVEISRDCWWGILSLWTYGAAEMPPVINVVTEELGLPGLWQFVRKHTNSDSIPPILPNS